MKRQRELQFFETPAAMRAWLTKHHRTADELHVGYLKRQACVDGARSITWQESVAEALCYGWIDGIRRTVDEDRYTIRFTPRRKGSKWSAINIRLVTELEAAGKMTEAGRAVFAARRNPEFKGHQTLKTNVDLDTARMREFKRHKPAWTFFQAQPPGYRRLACGWVMHAKQEETRDRRLAKLIQHSKARKRVAW